MDEGDQVARARGHLRGKQPKLNTSQARHLVELADLGTCSTAELADLFGVGRSTVHRTLVRMHPIAPTPASGRGSETPWVAAGWCKRDREPIGQSAVGGTALDADGD